MPGRGRVAVGQTHRANSAISGLSLSGSVPVRPEPPAVPFAYSGKGVIGEK